MQYAPDYFSAFRAAISLSSKLKTEVFVWMDRKTWNVSPCEPNHLPKGGFEIISAS